MSHVGRKGTTGFGRTYSLARGLAGLGHTVSLLTTQETGFRLPWLVEDVDGVRVYATPELMTAGLSDGGYGVLSTALKTLFWGPRLYDIVHSDVSHRPASGWPCRFNRWLRGSAYISEWWDNYGREGQLAHRDRPRTVLGRFLQRYECWAEIESRRAADGVVVLSEAARKRAISVGIPGDKLVVIHGGCETEDIRFREPGNRSGGYLKDCTLIFGFIGLTTGDEQDLAPFLGAFTLLCGALNLGLVTCGGKQSVNMKTRLPADRIVDLGWLNFRRESHRLTDVDVFVLVKQPNAKNACGWPNKLGDYLAFGRPVLCTRYGDVAPLMDQHPDCFYPVDWSEASILQTLRAIATESPVRRLERSRYARRIAEELFSWNAKARELESFYRRILVSRKNNMSRDE